MSSSDGPSGLPTVATVSVMIVTFALTIMAVMFGHAPGRKVLLVGFAVLLGCVLGKVFPQPQVLGLEKGKYLTTTASRGRSFVLTAATWSGGAAVLAVLVALLIGLSSTSDVGDRAGWAGTWGGVIGAVAGALVWTARRVVLDVQTARR
ncbi:hypothetical protein ACXPWS_05285 [Mycobacterium sp. BMJ-28]